jgi:hypothetical protein
MTLSLEELERRLSALERTVELLRESWPFPVPTETAAEHGARMLDEAGQDQEEIAAAWAEALRQMGISGQPIGVKALRELIAKDLPPGPTNMFSQGIIDMREE